MRKIAGSFGPFAIVRHRGRRTGRAYAAPVLAFGSEDGLVVGVLYGTTSDWVRNVLAGDGADVKWHGQSRAYDQPRLISSEEGLPTVPTVIRGPFASSESATSSGSPLRRWRTLPTNTSRSGTVLPCESRRRAAPSPLLRVPFAPLSTR